MALTNGPNLGLLVNGNAGETHYNELTAQWRGFDALIQGHVKDKDLNAPPGSPADGDCYIIGTSPSGAWAGRARQIARYKSIATAGWEFYVPKKGWSFHVEDENVDYQYNGTAWAPKSGLAAPKGYIDGLFPEYVNGTSLRVTSGSAYIPSLGYAVEVPAAITKSSLALAANTWYYVYLYLNAGVPDIEIVTTAPDTPYSGRARAKTGDASRRYLMSVKTNGSSNIFNFDLTNGNVLYKNAQDAAPFRVLSAGTATTETSVSLSGCVPVTARSGIVRLINLATAGNAYTGTSDDSAAGPPTSGMAALTPGEKMILSHALDASQAMTYWYASAPTGTGFFIDVYGFLLDR